MNLRKHACVANPIAPGLPGHSTDKTKMSTNRGGESHGHFVLKGFVVLLGEHWTI